MTKIASPRQIREIARKGKDLFQKLDAQLRETYFGKFVAIDADSGEYFIGDTTMEADKKARAKYPGKVFYA